MQEKNNEERNGLEIAVTGMSGRFPGAKNVHEFWENLKNGINSICFFTEEELLANRLFNSQTIKESDFVKARGIIEGVEFFDAFFFGYSPIEAEILDPQMRIFYELSWEALEDAACDPSTFPGDIGVYAGGTGNRWWEILNVMSGKPKIIGEFASNYLIDKDVLATRIAYRLDLKGPAITIHTACSTALVAVDLACRALLTSQCDAALAGGVSILFEAARAGGYSYKEGMIQSPDGNVRAFDARAKGVVFSDGAGAVLLKRLDDAIANGDHIYAVIKSSNTNNDGIRKSSFSAPAVDGQAEVIRSALYMADVEPESITYIETHGTGTEIGDPIEVEALKTAFNTDKKQYCALGSVKTNIGHLDSATGIASFIKVVLAINHRFIPPSLNFETPNPKIDFQNSPFFVNASPRQWTCDQYPLRAGVSSFGVGGTNAHVILEQAPQPRPSSPGRPYQLVLLSARSANALQQATVNLLEFLKQDPKVNLADAAFTLKTGRKAFEHRQMFVCQHTSQAIDILETGKKESTSDNETSRVIIHVAREEKRPVFMFPGQGSQYVNMAREIFETEPVFHQEMNRCFEILKPLMDYDIKEILYPPHTPPFGHPSQEGNFKKKRATWNPQLVTSSHKINQTEIAQPVIFVIEYALAKLLMAWGIQPLAMIGHSIGEYVAACLSGIFSLEDALFIVTWRGKLMQQMPTGSMLSVNLPEPGLKQLLSNEAEGKLDLAAVNGPSQCVVSGTHQDIEAFARQLEEKNIQIRKLNTSHAYHSKMMEPILTGFREKVSQVEGSAPQIPFISNLTGQWFTYQDAGDPNYWVKHLRSTVRFADGAAELLKEKNSVFIEVGPGRNLSTFIRQHPDKQPEYMLVNLVRHPQEEVPDTYYMLSKLGQIWLYGTPVDWNGFYAHENRQRLPLPTYPFQRQYFWVEGSPLEMIQEGMPGQVSLDKRDDITDWFYIPSWKRSVVPPNKPGETRNHHKWLVFIGDSNFAAQMLERIMQEEKEETRVTIVKTGPAAVPFTKEEGKENTYIMDHRHEAAYQALIEELHHRGQLPHRILYLWNLDPTSAAAGKPTLDKEVVQQSLDLGFYSLIYLTQALTQKNPGGEVEITVITNGMQYVIGDRQVSPEKSTVLGPIMIIPREFPHIKCRCIDIVLPQPGKREEQNLVNRLFKELLSGINEKENLVAYRDNYRLVRNFEPVPLQSPGLAEPGSTPPRLRQKGIYLITGGLGGIGLVMARYLAKTLQAKLILTGRSPFPAKSQWQQWLDTHDSLDNTSRKIRKVKELEALGAEVQVYSVDAADEPGMRNVVQEAKERFKTIIGVIHAAGLPGGGMIQLKTRETADEILTPKVKGAIALNNALALAGIEPNFFMLCSSINAVIPVLGQVDYYAANAFMDAFAFYKNTVDKTFTVSINWDAWQEVGMAVEAAKRQAGNQYQQNAPAKPMNHPLFDHYSPGVYTSYFHLSRHWVLSGHMTAEEKGLAPGVTYLEMVRAAFENQEKGKEGILEIRSVSFLNPLIVEQEEEKEVQTLLESRGDRYEFLVKSKASNGENQWQNHARGEVAFAPPQQDKTKTHDLNAIKAQCADKVVRREDRRKNKSNKERLVIFGPRWESMQEIRYGKNQALALIELPRAFTHELEQYKLYPAMLDNATAFLFAHINPQSAYIPFSYRKLTLRAPFPSRVYSYCRLAGPDQPRKESLEFNVTIMDEQGNELVDIEGFTMLEISEEIMERFKNKEQAASTPNTVETVPDETANRIALVKDGIAPKEGIEAFIRILAEDQPQVVVSTRDLPALLKAANSSDVTSRVEGLKDTASSAAVYSRPDISAQYIAPFNVIQEKLANIWQHLLGIKQVGIDDDFFELGGDSLKATAMIAKIKQELKAKISLRDIFNAPRIKDLSKHLDIPAELTDTNLQTFAPIKPLEEKEYYAVSAMQKKLYLLNQMEGIGTAYNLPFGHILQGKLDRQRLERTFQLLIQRHESLRTSFALVGNEPVQIIHQTGDLNPQISYWVSDHEIEDHKLNDLVFTFSKPFDLTRTPLLRIGLVKLAEEKHLLILDVHHIVSDGTSYLIMIRDFSILYENEGKNLPGLKLQYKDFAVWQNNESGKAAMKKQEEYWLNQFKGNIPLLELFMDYPRPTVQGFAGEKINFHFDQALTKKLDQLIIETKTTLFIVLLAAFNILLSKYSGQEDIIVGAPIAGRQFVDLENVNGVFINTLPIRNHPAANKTFTEFLKEVKENSLNAFENQGYPFAELIEKLDLNRDISRNPLYDVELIVQNISISQSLLKMPGTEVIPLPYEARAAQLDISLEAVEINERIEFFLTYCTELFKRETIDKFFEFFKKIISIVVENKEIKLEDITVFLHLEKTQLNIPQPGEITFGF